MPVLGAETIARNIKQFGGGFLNHVEKTMKKAVERLDTDIKENMSLTDHTLKDLANLGHPYARRHGEAGAGVHNPNWLVHKQSGRLLKSRKKGVSEASIISGRLQVSGFVMLDDSVAPYASAVVWGTSKMIPRNFLLGTLNQEETRSAINDIMSKNLKDFVFNFRGNKIT